ncbi:MAG: heparinase II/III-family protein, partial [Phycisphaerae bacterium]|nr:heparinase II/III-family protein [Phycisphaerae bacterium]
KKPKGQPSVVFPWAGQMIMRSGWDADAHWAFFDVGPWGTAHYHSDKLHLSVAAFGRDLLVDSGRYTYVYVGPQRAWHLYFRYSASHNVILIDGHGQNPDQREVSKPMKKDSFAVEAAFDFARGTFEKGYMEVKGQAVHTRAVLYVRGKFWVVVDRITTDRPRDIEALWHYHPACAVEIEDGSVTSTDAGKGNLRIVPVSPLPWKVQIVKGREKPSIQGWYSVRYNVKEPSPTAVYSAKIEKSATFAWILVPAKGTVPKAKAEIISEKDGIIRVGVSLPGAKPVIVTIPLKEGKPGIEKKGTGRRASTRAAGPRRTR